MNNTNIKRNSLDYILTDLLPVELSELFTFYYFYNYLVDNQNKVDKLVESILQLKNNSNKNIILFEHNKWASMPLKYSIIKTINSKRELNVVQPVAALEIYLFISTFEKEILNCFENTSAFSIRYHAKNNDLIYKQKRKSIIQYFDKLSKDLDKGVIQQTGMYFDIKPFRSIIDFTNSDTWFDSNLKYKYFARLDYKACFESIYTHTYVWHISKDVNDSIGFKNGNLYTTIDRVMQNINARTSNGIIVGPEFSRLIAEILLQGIDFSVFNILLNEGLEKNSEYCVYRFVDDLFIFSKTEELLDKIINLYNENAKKYMLHLNEGKLVKEKFPYILSPWLQVVSDYASEISNTLFYNQEERKGHAHAFKGSLLFKKKSSLKRSFNDIICEYESNRKSIVSYALGTILNKFSSGRNVYKLFKDDISLKTIYELLDYLFFIFSYFPSFENTQKIISVISYINDEIDLSKKNRDILQQIVNRYSYLFETANINDVINLILLCAKCNIEIPYKSEQVVFKNCIEGDNPIIWATYLVYTQYDKDYFKETLDCIEKIINEKMESILKKKNILTYKEIWWLLIFNKCPYISSGIQILFDTIIINDINARCVTTPNPCDDCVELVAEYLINSPNQFFEWDISKKDILQQITYRTHQRTIFKNYKYGRIEYSSI